MGKLTEQNIIRTVEEMIHEGLELGWIREKVGCIFGKQFTDQDWEGIMIQSLIRKAYTRPLPDDVFHETCKEAEEEMAKEADEYNPEGEWFDK